MKSDTNTEPEKEVCRDWFSVINFISDLHLLNVATALKKAANREMMIIQKGIFSHVFTCATTKNHIIKENGV